ncbi:serine/threonine-protein kinase [Acrocarpospora catenulata]|uniref:serine/threonine-protein kinase n=1 Tax=Acrocarpospora catenulata TaxID=2836182 RepID=UPI001BD98AE1|nr:serine/threonine-protein kinase [Acrocarpospora catenulata]
MAESTGEMLAARYRLLRPLGSGGMGTVWLARDETLDREVAVKELRFPEGLDERKRAEMVARVMREAEVTARLRHPAIVAVHDVLVEGGKPWIVMERLHGRNLGEEVRVHGPLPAPQVAEIGARMLEALAAAHALGVQHRDVKPANVFLTGDGRVVLTDFGIARPADTTALTGDGLLVGSPGYIAPERLSGEPGGPAADLWSLGATLYLALEGTPPFKGSQVEVLYATVAKDVPVPRAEGPIGPLIRWMLSRDPSGRPEPAAALELFRQIARGGMPEITMPMHARRPRARWWWILPVIPVVAAAAIFVPWGGAEPGTPVRRPSPVFAQPVDLCTVLSEAEVTALIGTAAPSKKIEKGCQWTVDGRGVRIDPETDSDTPDPWALTTESARTLLGGLRRRFDNGLREGQFIWYEIGADRKRQVVLSRPRDLPDVGEEAFATDVSTVDGRIMGGLVYFRLGDLVGKVEYADLGEQTPDQIRAAATRAARVAAETLWSRA